MFSGAGFPENILFYSNILVKWPGCGIIARFSGINTRLQGWRKSGGVGDPDKMTVGLPQAD